MPIPTTRVLISLWREGPGRKAKESASTPSPHMLSDTCRLSPLPDVAKARRPSPGEGGAAPAPLHTTGKGSAPARGKAAGGTGERPPLALTVDVAQGELVAELRQGLHGLHAAQLAGLHHWRGAPGSATACQRLSQSVRGSGCGDTQRLNPSAARRRRLGSSQLKLPSPAATGAAILSSPRFTPPTHLRGTTAARSSRLVVNETRASAANRRPERLMV